MKELFPRGRGNGMKAKDISDFFGITSENVHSRAYLIRTELRKVKRTWEAEYQEILFDGQVGEKAIRMRKSH